jgi:hypothetical protein
MHRDRQNYLFSVQKHEICVFMIGLVNIQLQLSFLCELFGCA